MSTMTEKGKKPKDRSRDRHKSQKTFRIPDEMYEDLKAVAEFNERPMSWEIRAALRRHIAEVKKRMGQNPPGQ